MNPADQKKLAQALALHKQAGALFAELAGAYGNLANPNAAPYGNLANPNADAYGDLSVKASEGIDTAARQSDIAASANKGV